MKNFYDMIEIMEQDEMPPAEQGPEKGLGNETAPTEEQPKDTNVSSGSELKHYMFFSNLKSIRERAEAILAMDANEVDRMIGDGHDWASDHISSSKDDVEEVYNWLSGQKNP